MRKNIVGILVVTLLIAATVLPVAGTVNICRAPEKLSTVLQGVKDQYQETSDECAWLSYGVSEWQTFVPVGTTLYRVELYLYNSAPHEAGSVRLSIEKPYGTKLSDIMINCNDIAPGYTDVWLSFDVPDIALERGKEYFIVLYYEGPCEICWHGAYGDKYPDGGSSKAPDWDYCFRTFVDKSKPKLVEGFEFTHPLHMPSPPDITVTDPLGGIKIAIAPDVHIMGYVTDDTGIDGFGYVIEYADGTGMGPFNTIDPPVTHYPFDIHEYVKEGTNYLTVEASDIDGNMATEDVTIIYIKTKDMQMIRNQWSNPLLLQLMGRFPVLTRLLSQEI